MMYIEINIKYIFYKKIENNKTNEKERKKMYKERKKLNKRNYFNCLGHYDCTKLLEPRNGPKEEVCKNIESLV